MTSWLVRSPTNRVVWVLAAGDLVLCYVLGLDTLLSVPLSTQVRRTSCLGGVGGGKTCEGVEILLVASCYEKREGGGGDR